MAQFLVRNSLNPGKVVKLGITFEQLTPKGNEGEPLWLVEIATNEPHKDGGNIPPEFINLTSLDNLDQEVQKSVETISAKIDWTPLEDDVRPPFVESCYPDTYETSIESNVDITIKDLLPAAGIDISTIRMVVTADGRDFDVTPELSITGNPYEYKVSWKPYHRGYN